MGEFSTDVSGVVPVEERKLFAKAEKSESDPEPAEFKDDDDDAELRLFRSGAVYARTLVVDRSSVGNEISSRFMVPGA